MKGATADPSVNTKRAPNSTRQIMFGIMDTKINQIIYNSDPN